MPHQLGHDGELVVDEPNTERVVIQQELKQEQQHVQEIKTEQVYHLQIVEQLLHHNLVVKVVVEVVVNLVL